MADETSYGWAGKILRVNLSTGSITTQPTDPYKEYIGGMGLANKIMYDEVPAGTGTPIAREQDRVRRRPPDGLRRAPLAGRTTISTLSTFTKDHLVVDAHCGGMIGAKMKAGRMGRHRDRGRVGPSRVPQHRRRQGGDQGRQLRVGHGTERRPRPCAARKASSRAWHPSAPPARICCPTRSSSTRATTRPAQARARSWARRW